MKKTKAILINPETKSISEVEVGDYKHIQELIDCDCFTVGGYLQNGDCVYCDDEGLLHGGEKFFVKFVDGFCTNPAPLVGNLLIVGTDEETGDSADCKSTCEEIRDAARPMTDFQALMFAKMAGY